MAEQLGGRALFRDVRDNLPQLRDALRELPTILNHLGEQAANGRIRFNLHSPELERIRKQLAEQRKQRFWLMTAAVGVVTGSVFLTLGTSLWLGWPILAGGLLAGILARP